MIHQIAVTPAAEDAADFRVRFCSESFSIPGFSWPMELLNGVHFHHHLRRMGCSPKQIAVIVRWIETPLTEVCSVSREGVVDLFPYEEDFSAYEDGEDEEEEEEEDEEEEKETEATRALKEKWKILLQENPDAIEEFSLEGKRVVRFFREPVYRDGHRIGTTIGTELAPVDEEWNALLKEHGSKEYDADLLEEELSFGDDSFSR